MKSLFLISPALFGAVLLSACAERVDVPPPDDAQAQEWTYRIKGSYPDWQPPREMPEANPDYKPTQLIAPPEPDHKADFVEPELPVEPKTVLPEKSVDVIEAPEEKEEPIHSQSSLDVTPKPVGLQKADGQVTYTVQKGDSLSKIAKKQYGDGMKWWRVYEANKAVIKDPNRLVPGTVLTIPALSK